MMDESVRQFLFQNSTRNLADVRNVHVREARIFLDACLQQNTPQFASIWLAQVAFTPINFYEK